MKKRINITNGAIVSDTASVKQYLKETSKTKSLTKAQEIELAQLAQGNCEFEIRCASSSPVSGYGLRVRRFDCFW
jgi:hypothetical protein